MVFRRGGAKENLVHFFDILTRATVYSIVYIGGRERSFLIKGRLLPKTKTQNTKENT